MLGDPVRTETFRRAIEAVVRPGMRVLDFGSGTGVLAFFAHLAGAATVFAVDSSPFIKAARAVAKKNGFDIEFIKTSGDDFELPTKVDLIVSECLGHYLFTDRMLPALFRARDRYLEVDGQIIPQSVELKASLVIDAPIDRNIQFYDTPHYGIDFSALRPLACGRRRKHVLTNKLVSPHASMGTVDLRNDTKETQSTRGQLQLNQDRVVYGIGAWFDAYLTPGVMLETGPTAPRTCWEQNYFPFEKPTNVTAGLVQLGIDH